MKLFNKNDIRSNKIYKNVAFSFLLKFIATIILFVMVPLTLTCLGNYQNGVWLTISSLLIWIDQMDIGLGNGLRNKLSISIAHHDMEEARKMVSSCMAMLTCIIIPLDAASMSSALPDISMQILYRDQVHFCWELLNGYIQSSHRSENIEICWYSSNPIECRTLHIKTQPSPASGRI